MREPGAGRREQAIDFGDRQDLRQRTAALGTFDRGGRIGGAMTLEIEKPVELADRAAEVGENLRLASAVK